VYVKTQLIREVQCAVNLAEKLQPFVEGREEEFINYVKSEVASLSKATFGEPLLHAIGEAYLSAAEKYIGYKEGFLGIDGFIASMKQKTRSNMAYLDVASKGVASINRMRRMSEISEQARLRDMEDLIPPTEEMIKAKEAAYSALSVKELREMCKERVRKPGSTSEADKGLDLSNCVEKKEIVRAILDNDALVFADIQKKHAAWKAGGCEGPPPARAYMKQSKAKPPAAAAGGGEEETPAGDGAFGMAEDMSPESQAQMAAEMESSLPVFMSALVSASLLDVEVTLKPVLKKCLDDHGITEEQRLRRAKGLLIMAGQFIAAKGANKGARGEVDAKHVLEGTMMKTMAKAQGQEVDDDDDFMAMREDLEKNMKEYEEGVKAEDEKDFGSAKDGGKEDDDDGKHDDDYSKTSSPMHAEAKPVPTNPPAPAKSTAPPEDDLD
jgi:hypothetical protein